MFRVECKNAARLAATVGLGLSLAFTAAPAVAVAEEAAAPSSGVSSNVAATSADDAPAAETPDESKPVWIGDKGYDSLADAIATVPTDGTQVVVQLRGNTSITSNLTLKSGTNVELDLNGCSIVADNKVVVKGGGALTISDSSSGSQGTITGDVNNLIQLQDKGSLTLKSGSITTSATTAVSLFLGSPSFSMSGGSLSAKTNAVKVSFGSAIISGGVINGAIRAENDVSSAPAITIGSSGSTDGPQIKGNFISNLKNATIELESGTIDGVEGMLPASAVINCAFKSDISASLPASMNKGCSQSNGLWVVDTLTEANAGIKVTDSNGDAALYASLASFNQASDAVEPGDTVTLLKDTVGSLVFDQAGNYTVDLGGFTLLSMENPAVAVQSSGSAVSIKNGAIVSESEDARAAIIGVYGSDSLSNVDVKLNNVNLSMVNDGNAGIIVQGMNTNNNVTLSGCELTVPSTVMGIYFPPANSTLTITDTKITAGTGIGIKGGTLNISGNTTINASGEKGEPGGGVEGGGIQETGDAIYIEAEYGRDVKVNIDGGEFKSANSNAVKAYVNDSYTNSVNVEIEDGTFTAAEGSDAVTLVKENESSEKEATIAVSGGAFSSKIDEGYCADGFKPITTPNSDGQYVVAQSEDVVQVGDTKYDSIAAALNDVSGDVTITLLADVYEDVTIPEDKSVTLDLAGFTLTNNSGHTITNNGNLTIVDSVGGGVVDNVTNGRAAVFNAEGATADIQAGTFMRSKEAGSKPDSDGGNSYYTILNQGMMTLGKNVVVESKLSNGSYSSRSSVIANGWQNKDTPKGGARVTAKLTINGAHIEGGLYLKNDRYGELEMNSGYVKGTAAGIFNYGTATISGGTVAAELDDRGAVWNYEEHGYDEGAAPAKLTITGGTLNAGDNQFAIRVTVPKGGDDSIRTSITITGGEINGGIGAKESDTTLSSKQFKITGGTYTENPVDLMDAADNSVVRHEGNGEFSVLERKDLQAGTYEVPKGADPLTAKDFQPGMNVVKDGNGNYVATRPTPSKGEHAVKVEQAEGGKVAVTPTTADEGDEVTIAATPDKGQEVRSVTVTTKDGKKVKVTKGSKENTWTFEMPDSEVTVSVVFGCDGGELCPTHKFDDVDAGAWYHDAVDWAVEEGLLSGYEDGTLGPDGTLSRAQLATVLWRQAGEPEAASEASFADCDPAAFYAEAVAWADESGIIAGYGDGTNFGPEDPVTREQLATILWRQAGEPEGKGDLSGYPDGDKATDYAVPALEWAVDTGVLSGFGDGTLAPGGVLSRAMLAAMLQRMAE